MRILILGHKSFVANGLYEKIKSKGLEVDCFSRGNYGKKNDFIYGDVYELSTNEFFKESYDVVINFILLKDCDLYDNKKFIDQIQLFCNEKKVTNYIHISSIIVYDYKLKNINEKSSIDLKNKYNRYANLKRDIDVCIEKKFNNQKTFVSYVRPGFVVEKINDCGFALKLFSNIYLLKGDKKSKLPLIEKKKIHDGLFQIISNRLTQKVYLFVPNKNHKKIDIVKNFINPKVLFVIPRYYILPFIKFLRFLKVIDMIKYQSFLNMYSKVDYNSTLTTKTININFEI